MSGSLLRRQAELPRSVPLFRYAPERIRFSWRDWNPALVRSANDLPQYLILGALDPATFELSAEGWSARWQGTGHNTHLRVAYTAEPSSWEIHQVWRGIEGVFGQYSARWALDKVIAQALYARFPSSWDEEAKSHLESAYQITVVQQPENAYSFCGIPDGAFRTLAFPVAVGNLRPVQQWIQRIVDESPLPYPIVVQARLLFQTVNYVEGEAAPWTTQEAVVFKQSVVETGLAPLDIPVRQEASDGSAAWTLHREIYFLFISLPFAGLADLLGRMVTASGPIRKTSDPFLRIELRPIVFPAGFEQQTESLAIWDEARTTRSFLQFARPGQDAVPTLEDIIAGEERAASTLAKIEAISGDVVKALEQLFQPVINGGES